jgi:hypothetical protein
MKKILIVILISAFCISMEAQKISALTEATVADDNSLIMTRVGASGDLIKKITIGNVFKDRTLTGTVTLPATTSIGSVSDTEIGYVNGLNGTAASRNDVRDSLLNVLNGATELSSVASMLADIRPYFVFGSGSGADADSTLFAKGAKAFGSFRVIEDSLYVHSLTNLYMTSGDSLRFNVYYGNGMTRVATDSLFTAPQGAGSYATQTFTPNNKRTINHDQDVWIGIIGPQPANMRPKEWVFQLNAKIVRD